MKHVSAYLDWYVHVPKVKYDFRSSGLTSFRYSLKFDDADLSVNYAYGNPEVVKLLAERYGVKPENIFVSSEGASGQNARIIRCIAERSRRKCEAIVEYPTYEPLLRQVQEHFPRVKRLERDEQKAYGVDGDCLRRIVSDKTGLLVLTNPHAPSSAVLSKAELSEVMAVAQEFGFYVLCDEIYAEFSRENIPTVFAVNEEFGITTTSFTKAYGLGGIKLGVALANEKLVKEFYTDTLSTVGNAPNIVQLVAVELLTRGKEALESHMRKWEPAKREMEEWLEQKGYEHFPNRAGVTYWVKLPINDTLKWVNEHAVPKHSLAAVPGAFFLYRKGYETVKSNRVRLGLGNINPEKTSIKKALEALETAVKTYANR